jgi:hypothetical protein
VAEISREGGMSVENRTSATKNCRRAHNAQEQWLSDKPLPNIDSFPAVITSEVKEVA